jgi:hypothetical protein
LTDTAQRRAHIVLIGIEWIGRITVMVTIDLAFEFTKL